jgi:hypothetical protein
MVQLKKDTSYDDPYRRLVTEKKAEWKGLRGLLTAAGIAIDKEVYVLQWLKGKLDKKKKPYPPPLKGEVREKLFAFLKAQYAEEFAEIKNAPMKKLLEEASKIATLVPTPTEIHLFAEYVMNGAIVTMVTSHSVTAEGSESTRTYAPREGLTEEVYRRLAADDLMPEMLEELAWGVIGNLLSKKGLSAAQIRQARRRITEKIQKARRRKTDLAITDLVELNSFDVIVDAIYDEAVKAPKKKRK